MNKVAIFTLTALLSLAAGCDRRDDQPASQAPTAQATAAATATAQAKARTKSAKKADPLDKEEIPVAADYEEKAEKEITKDNLEDKLAELEKELTEGT